MMLLRRMESMNEIAHHLPMMNLIPSLKQALYQRRRRRRKLCQRSRLRLRRREDLRSGIKLLCTSFNTLSQKGCKTVETPIVPKHNFFNCEGSPDADVNEYRSLIGSFLYLSATRLDIMFAVSLLSRFMNI
ncbi:uncharacterized protein LOC119990411 [Tripterygium wilfordii]|uniref:uncharacterized protein LOC119990411 n=1 Tax=Tripterygium wilfordii TaxID=458696 RepID=UPI0018F7F9E0|nr:uncharacterized protein LOC119990411 [Tripterygium wilfordii]XP_038692231.1 uncharacterized protein LOC119990411 [Tripterygium wilfordii]